MSDRSYKVLRAQGIFKGSKYSDRDKDWANWVLREGLKELKNLDRDRKARFAEVIYFIDLLAKKGFWWQARILRSHLYRSWSNLRPKADPPRGEEERS